MKNMREFIGQTIYLVGLMTVVLAIAISGDFGQPADGFIVAGAVAVLIGYCVQGWHRPTIFEQMEKKAAKAGKKSVV